MFGVHISKSEKLFRDTASRSLEAAIRDEQRAMAAEGLTMKAVQIFTHGPRVYTPITMDHKAMREVCAGMQLIVHSTYPTVSLWSGGDEKKRAKVLGHLKAQLTVCDAIDAHSFIIHLPRKPLAHVLRVLSEPAVAAIFEAHRTPIAFEIVPDKDVSRSFAFVDNLSALTTALTKIGPRMGICIDTSHMWGAGIDVGDEKTLNEYFRELKHPERVLVIHLNGSSKATFGSGRDVHEIAMTADDDIFTEPTIRIVGHFARAVRCPIIYEINRGNPVGALASMRILAGHVVRKS